MHARMHTHALKCEKNARTGPDAEAAEILVLLHAHAEALCVFFLGGGGGVGDWGLDEEEEEDGGLTHGGLPSLISAFILHSMKDTHARVHQYIHQTAPRTSIQRRKRPS